MPVIVLINQARRNTWGQWKVVPTYFLQVHTDALALISIRDADYSHQIVLSLLDLKTFHRPVNYLIVIISYCSTYKYASQYLSVNAEAEFFAP